MTHTSDEIRQMFLNFFREKNHTILPGSSLVPDNDSSLLFTNAGMNQFKDIFLNQNNNLEYTRVATLQNCLRTGGKHNDFENVGYTSYHHTFFEMLGNFSFRDYFKLDAILYAWEFLTSKKQLNLSKEKLWITVYKDDLESYNIWKNIVKIEDQKIIKIGDKKQKYNSDNFWQMGETGPCGPSTEIFYDYGSNFSGVLAGANTNSTPRFIEIWNIVFIQFNKLNNGKLLKLKTPSVDTGMGLERIVAVINNVTSNYEIDLFKPLIEHISDISTVKNIDNKSLYVISDHIRSCAFIISENISPSNEKHGYILRKIIRRAIRYGYKLGIKNLFLYKLIPTLINSMGKSGLILLKNQNKIEKTLQLEESKFISTLEKGLKLLEKTLKKLSNTILSGKTAFNLYDTFGFPIDLTIDICRENNVSVNYIEFLKYLKQHKKNSVNVKFLKTQNTCCDTQIHEEKYKTIFVGYQFNEVISMINSIIVDNNTTKKISDHQNGIIFLDKTPFYGESGGQIGDSGIIQNNTGKFIVKNTKNFGDSIGHIGKLISGYFNIGDKINAKIDISKRKLIQINHSATHLLHASLRTVLGKHVFQKGSFISDKIIRFDFSHDCPISLNEIHKIEEIINEKIQDNILIQENYTTLKEIKNKNVMALFEEKYKNIVRLISINNFSAELCKGTHTKHTGNINIFKIISEINISSGIRRIEAKTGQEALFKIHNQETTLKKITTILKTKQENIQEEIDRILKKTVLLEKEIHNLYKYKICNIVKKLSEKYITIKNTKIIMEIIKSEDIISLRKIIDQLKNKFKSSIIIIISFINKKSIIIIGVTNNIVQKISALQILKKITKTLGGSGGGKNNIAEGKIKNTISLSIELKKIGKWIDSKL